MGHDKHGEGLESGVCLHPQFSGMVYANCPNLFSKSMVHPALSEKEEKTLMIFNGKSLIIKYLGYEPLECCHDF